MVRVNVAVSRLRPGAVHFGAAPRFVDANGWSNLRLRPMLSLGGGLTLQEAALRYLGPRGAQLAVGGYVVFLSRERENSSPIS